ncbi:MAG: hypothetical protein JJE27_03285, partial [Thermoleophilia bacterium]|nr:hypothetical protein [Thermoleophilia bacterium]
MNDYIENVAETEVTENVAESVTESVAETAAETAAETVTPGVGVASAGDAVVQLGDSLTLHCGMTLPNRIAKSAMAEAMGG